MAAEGGKEELRKMQAQIDTLKHDFEAFRLEQVRDKAEITGALRRLLKDFERLRELVVDGNGSRPVMEQLALLHRETQGLRELVERMELSGRQKLGAATVAAIITALLSGISGLVFGIIERMS